MIKIAIVNTDLDFLKIINNIVIKLGFEKHIPIETDLFITGKSLLFKISDTYYDIFLLDIIDNNGFEIARKIKSTFPESYIIFISSYIHFSLDAFELNAFRFIRKNKINEKLPKALKDCWKEISSYKNEYYIIRNHVKQEKIYLKNILYIFKDGKNTIFVTTYGVSKIRKALIKVYDEIENDEFIMIDRSYIVNIIHVIKIFKNELTLQNGEIIIISRLHLQKVKAKITWFWGNNILNHQMEKYNA